jgi:hypothetical protein
MSDAAIANVIAVVAALVAIAALWLAARTNRKQIHLQEQQNRLQADLVRIEQVRERDRVVAGSQAKLQGQLFAGISGGMTAHLRVTNLGAATARNIRITIDETPILRHSAFRRDPLPGAIAPGAPVNFRMVAFDGMETRYRVAIDWDDESGHAGHWNSTVSILPANAH